MRYNAMIFNLRMMSSILSMYWVLLSDAESQNHVDSIKFLDYEIKIIENYSDLGPNSHQKNTACIGKKGKIIEKFSNHTINLSTLGYLKFQGDSKAKPYLIFNTWSGGTHCCAGFVVYELVPELKKLLLVEGDSNATMLINSPHDTYSIRIHDTNFLYWHTSYTDSPFITIELVKNEQGNFDMKEQSDFVDQKELNKKAKLIAEDDCYWKKNESMKEPYYPGKITETVVQLIYQKHPELAIKFLDLAWSAKNLYKEQFKVDLKKKLHANPYWRQLERKGYKLPF